jgi:hypothetical protein
MASSTQAVRTASRFDGVYAAVGVHPNDAMEATPQVLEVIDRLAEDEPVVGVGETGLDYYRDHTTPAQQEARSGPTSRSPSDHDRTLVIHCRDAWDDCLEILEDQGAPDRVVMHCFSGDLEVTRRCAEAGWYLSFAGNVTFRNAEDAAARQRPPRSSCCSPRPTRRSSPRTRTAASPTTRPTCRTPAHARGGPGTAVARSRRRWRTTPAEPSRCPAPATWFPWPDLRRLGDIGHHDGGRRPGEGPSTGPLPGRRPRPSPVRTRRASCLHARRSPRLRRARKARSACSSSACSRCR